MAECNLDWKKVFKEILGAPQCNKSEDEQCKEGQNVVPSEFPPCTTASSSNKLNEKSFNYCHRSLKKVSQVPFVEEEPFFSRSNKGFKNNSSDIRKSTVVPEWNKVFKSILGNSAQEQKEIKCPIEKPETLQKPKPVKKRFYRNKKMDEEERKVRELFAQSRLFKADCSFKCLNDIAGSGVDIFKRDKQLVLPLSEGKSLNESLLDDDDKCDQYSRLNVPLKGIVANIKPLTREDILNEPCIPVTEVWDDVFLL